jgi:hypothetical protein
MLGMTGIVGLNSDTDHGCILMHGRRRPRVILVRHARPRVHLVLVLGHHAVVILLGGVGHVIGVHGRIHMLGMILRRVLVRVRRRVRWRMLSSAMIMAWAVSMSVSTVLSWYRASNWRTSGHLDWRLHAADDLPVGSSLCRRYVLPSRQMAASHLAGLGVL